MLSSALQINVLIDFCVKFPIYHHLHQLSTCVQSQPARLPEKGVEMHQRRVNGQKTFLVAFMIRQNPVCHAFCTAHHIQFIDANHVQSMPKTWFSCFKVYLKCIVITRGPAGGDCWFACYTIGFLGGDNFQVIREYNGPVGQHSNDSMAMVRPRLQLLPKQTFLTFATHDPQYRLGIFL